MPRKEATKIKLNGDEEEILTQIYCSAYIAMRIKYRAAIILLANEGKSNNSIVRKLRISSETVTKWRNRYANCHEEIVRAGTESPMNIQTVIVNALSDTPSYKI